MKILYHSPHYKTTIYAYRTVVNGFKNAFEDMGYDFKIYTAGDNLEELLYQFQPDIFMTQTHPFYQKYLDLKLLNGYRNKGMCMLTKVDFWQSFYSSRRINEVGGLRKDKKTIALIKEGLIGDYFYHVVEQGDPRMDGFEKTTGYKFYTIPLAADKIILEESKLNNKFISDISFIGTNLPEKRKYFEDNILPLRDKYDLRLYGQDWTTIDKMLGWVQRGGQYFNLPYLRSIQKPKLSLGDEGDVYISSAVSINIHEDSQRKFGGDCNERTFKIPMAGGFEITDDVSCIRKYFKDGEEIIIARNKADWREKIDYFMRFPEKRDVIITAGKKRVLAEHTYHNRVNQIVNIFK